MKITIQTDKYFFITKDVYNSVFNDPFEHPDLLSIIILIICTPLCILFDLISSPLTFLSSIKFIMRGE